MEDNAFSYLQKREEILLAYHLRELSKFIKITKED